jgi:hypothetical protein
VDVGGPQATNRRSAARQAAWERLWEVLLMPENDDCAESECESASHLVPLVQQSETSQEAATFRSGVAR